MSLSRRNNEKDISCTNDEDPTIMCFFINEESDEEDSDDDSDDWDNDE